MGAANRQHLNAPHVYAADEDDVEESVDDVITDGNIRTILIKCNSSNGFTNGDIVIISRINTNIIMSNGIESKKELAILYNTNKRKKAAICNLGAMVSRFRLWNPSFSSEM